MIEPLKVIEPYSPIVKKFSNPGEFKTYYICHKSEIDAMTTCQLNKTFEIPGYHLAKMKNAEGNKELIIRKEYYHCKNKVNEPDNLKYMQDQIDDIKRVVQQLVDKFNEKFA
jgi:hypothetical protein